MCKARSWQQRSPAVGLATGPISRELPPEPPWRLPSVLVVPPRQVAARLALAAGTASGRNSEGEAQADRRQLELEVRRAKPRSDFELVRSAKAFL